MQNKFSSSIFSESKSTFQKKLSKNEVTQTKKKINFTKTAIHHEP